MTINKDAPFPFSLRQFQYIVAVAETGSFRRAAERCHVSQPSLSAQVAGMEAGLGGVRLFERDRRRVLITDAGRVLVERARRVLVEAADLAEAAAAFADSLAGPLRLGVIPTIGPYLLPEIDPTLRAAFPRLRLSWREDKTTTLVRMVREGALDAALLAAEADLSDLHVAALARDPFVLATAPGHPLTRERRAVRLEDLRGERVLLLDEGHCFRDQVLELCSRARTEESPFRATSLSTLAQMAAGGNGVTLLPSIAVEVENRRGALILAKLRRPAPFRTLALAWRRRSARAETLERVAERLREACRPATRSARPRP